MEKECSIVASEPRNTLKGLLNMWKQDLIDREEKKQEEEEERGDDSKERELENYRIMWLKSKERLFPLLEFVKMLLAPPQCPSYKEEGGGVT